MPKQHSALVGNDLHHPKGIGVETTAEYLVISQSLNIISGSAESTGSFGRVLATTFKGDGSSLTGVTAEWDGTHSGNGTITGNFTVSGNISGSSTSTGSFGRVESTKIAGTLTTAAQTNITSVGTIGAGVWNGTTVASAYLDADTAHLTTTQTFSGDKTFSSTLNTAAITATGNVSGSSTSTGSFGKVLGDGSSLTGISSFAGAAGTETVFSGSAASTGSFGKLIVADSIKFPSDNLIITEDVVASVSFISSTDDTTLPSNIQSGDLLIIIFGGRGSWGSGAVTAGYTLIGSNTGNGNYGFTAAWYKVATGSETSIPTVGGYGGQQTLLIRGANSANPIDAGPTYVDGGADPGSITTVTDNSMVILATGIGTQGGPYISAAPSGYSNYNQSGYGSSGYNTGAGYCNTATKIVTSAGSEDPGSWTSNGQSTGYWAHMIFAIRGGISTLSHGYDDIKNTGFTTISGSSTSTGSFGKVLGDGSQLTNLPASYTSAQISGSWQGQNFSTTQSFSDGTATLISGSIASTGSFGHILKGGVNWDTAVSSSAATAGFGAGGGGSSFAGAAGTETLFSGSAVSTGSFGSLRVTSPTLTVDNVGSVSGSSTSTGSFGAYIGDGSQLTGISAGFDYTSGSSPVVTTNPSSIGATWINTTSGEIFVATDITTGENNWLGTAGTEVAPPPLAYFGGRGLWGGGPYINIIDYITIATTGNAQDFGDLTVGRGSLGACSDGTKGLWGGGVETNYSNVIDYITIATTGNASDFGDLTIARTGLAACSDGTKGLWGGGSASGYHNTIDYITIATTGNASDFGNLTVGRYAFAACSDGTKGVFGGGYGGSTSNVIDYITIATTGNASDFGDLTVARSSLAACSDGTKGVFGAPGTTIDYITIATTGNATDFGDLTVGRTSPGACSDGTKGLWGGGYAGASKSNVIDYVTIATTGNATDFGDLTRSEYVIASCSGT